MMTPPYRCSSSVRWMRPSAGRPPRPRTRACAMGRCSPRIMLTKIRVMLSVSCSDLVKRRVTARELRARLSQPILVLGTPAPPLAEAADRIHQLEQLEAPQHLGCVEQVAGEHRDHALLELPRIAR